MARTLKTGNIAHPLNGATVAVTCGEHAGKVGTVSYTDRAPTFSQMVPYTVRHGVRFEDGNTHEFRKEHLRRVKPEQLAAARAAQV